MSHPVSSGKMLCLLASMFKLKSLYSDIEPVFVSSESFQTLKYLKEVVQTIGFNSEIDLGETIEDWLPSFVTKVPKESFFSLWILMSLVMKTLSKDVWNCPLLFQLCSVGNVYNSPIYSHT